MRVRGLGFLAAAVLTLTYGCSPTIWIGAAAAIGLAGGGGGGGGGAADLRIALGPNSPDWAQAFENDMGVPMLQIRLEAVREDVDVDSITFHADGSGDDSLAGIIQVNLYHDVNGDGLVDGGDTLLQGPRQYSADDGDVTFTFGTPVTVQYLLPQDWLLAYDFGPAAAPLDYFCASMWDRDDVTATRASGTARVRVGGGIMGCVNIIPDPRIISVTPNRGALAGGTTVTIVTRDFVQDDFTSDAPLVQFGGVDATNITGTAADTVQVTTPQIIAPGFVDVFLSAQSGDQATLANGFQYVPNCTISAVNPVGGSTAGGAAVTITGTNFESTDPALDVTFGGTLGSIVTATPTQIDVTAPSAASAGVVDVAVTSTNTTCSLPGSFTYFDTPTIVSVTPDMGPLMGGGTVTILTASFSDDFMIGPPTSVTFGGITSLSFGGISPDAIDAVVPMGASTGFVDVFVQGASGDQATLVGGYEYLVPVICTINLITPSAGPMRGGVIVTIDGANFMTVPPNLPTVTFGGFPAAVDPATTDTQIICTAPSAVVAGPVTVQVTNFTGGVCDVIDGFTYDTIGILDTSFNSQGWVVHDDAAGGAGNDRGHDIAMDGSGSIVVAGHSVSSFSGDDMAIWRYVPAGVLDTTFGAIGFVVHDGAALGGGDDVGRAVIEDSTSRLIVAGSSLNFSPGNLDTALWAYDSLGFLDMTFGALSGVEVQDNAAGGSGDDEAYDLIEQSSTRLIVTGQSWNAVPNIDMVIWAFDLAGVLDPAFGSAGVVVDDGAAGGGGDDFGRSVLVDPSADIIVAGRSSNGTDMDMAIWSFNSSGSPNNSFGTGGVVIHGSAAGGGGDDWGESITMDGNAPPDFLVTGRSFNGTDDDMVIWRYSSTGNIRTSFGVGGVVVHDNAAGGSGDDAGLDIIVEGLAPARILVTGRSFNGSDDDMVIWRFNDDGSLDTLFNSQGWVVHDGAAGGTGDDEGAAITRDMIGRILVTGSSHNGSDSDMVIWRYE